MTHYLPSATRRLLIALGLLASGGCVTPEPTYDQLMREGVREVEAGNFADAVGMFSSAAEKDPERPEPSYQKGKCFLAMADRQFIEDDLPGALRYCDRAIAEFDKAISAFPGYSYAVTGKADALKLRNKHAAAFDIASWVAAQTAYRAKSLILQSRQYSSVGDLDNAQLSLEKAVAVEPDNAIPHAEIGRFYLRMNNREKAITHLQRAYELNPGVPGVFQALIELGAVPAPSSASP